MSWSTRMTWAPICSGMLRMTSPSRCVSSSGSPAAGSSSKHETGRADDGPGHLDEAALSGAERADVSLRDIAEADELDRFDHVADGGSTVRLRCARGPGARSRTPEGSRSPARSGTCAARPSAPAGSRPSTSRSSPNARTTPAIGRTNPLSTLKNVVLPAPFGPIRPHVPAENVTVIRSIGTTPPNRTVNPSTSITLSAPQPRRRAPRPAPVTRSVPSTCPCP